MAAGIRRSAASSESFTLQNLAWLVSCEVTSCKNGDIPMINLTNQHSGEQIQLLILVQTMTLHRCHAQQNPNWLRKLLYVHMCAVIGLVQSSFPCVDRQLEDARSFVFGPQKAGCPRSEKVFQH